MEAKGRDAVMPGPRPAPLPRARMPMAAPAPELSVVVVLPPGIVPEVGYAAGLRAALATLGCPPRSSSSPPRRTSRRPARRGRTPRSRPRPATATASPSSTACAAPAASGCSLVDADLREPGPAVVRLWAARDRGRDRHRLALRARRRRPRVPALRRGLSRALNRVFRRGLSLGVADLSSATRLVRRKTLAAHYDARGYDILQELLVRAYADGWRVVEVPIDYEPAHPGAAYPRALGVGADYLRRFWALWKLRNSILAADYDDRAHDSAIWLQRYWQRQRFKHITELVAGQGRGPRRRLRLEPDHRRAAEGQRLHRHPAPQAALRAAVRPAAGARLGLHAAGARRQLPVRAVLAGDRARAEGIADSRGADRALAPGGRLVLGTPDYARWEWVVTEKLYGLAAPGGYADEHIGHYTREELIARYTRHGLDARGRRATSCAAS